MAQAVLSGHQSVNNINVYYEFYPNHSSDKTVILLHGFLSSTFTFRHLIPLLSQEFQVLLLLVLRLDLSREKGSNCPQ